MKKYLPFILIGGILVLVAPFIVGAFFLSPTRQSNNGEPMNNKPADQSHRSYDIDVIEKPTANQITLNEPTTIKYRIKDDKGNVVTDFAIAHEKVMHFIVVRKDLTQFQHLHPDFNKETGEFSVAVTFSTAGLYHFFADFTPETDNPMQLPVTVYSDLPVGDVADFQPQQVTPDTKKEVSVPPDYQVTYTLPSELRSQTPVTYSLVVEKDNQPVTLEKYLGALGHSVVLKEGTLDYIHTHAGEQGDSMEHGEHGGHAMPPAQQENQIDFSTTFPDAGIYRIFTQFQHQGNVLTTAYTVAVK
jgi:hypothetical protein